MKILFIVLMLIASPLWALDVEKEIGETYTVINEDGKGSRTATTFVIREITEMSYVGDLYADGVIVAKDRRFLFADSIVGQLTIGEKGLVNKTLPNDEWASSEIKTYLDSKEIEYGFFDFKSALLDLIVESKVVLEAK